MKMLAEHEWEGEMNPDWRKNLLAFLAEYDASMNRTDGEKDHQKAIAQRVLDDLGVDPKHFVRLATAYHRDEVAKAREDLQAQLSLYETAAGEPEEEDRSCGALNG